MIFLSYVLKQNTPTYGDRNRFEIIKKNAISKGDIANDSFMSTTVHIGTHIDMPYHFYDNGQTIEDFDPKFWVFENPLIVEITPKDLIIKDELIAKLSDIKDNGFDILIIKTGICHIRDEKRFWSENYGFHPDIYDFLIDKFPKVRVFGFDSISVSSFTDRLLGREAHKRFLNPEKPLLLLEDMDLRNIDEKSTFGKIIVAPLRISDCDGLPCTIMGFPND
ncbi:cyclase family protein [Sulfurimonas sp. HSL3-2]|uniref:cyclase family protein n=1 Tax=Hydrocurvibacter mobilis TaxID=3131936 RepID=UPI0031F7A27E